MEINHILKIRDILYEVCPLMTSDSENILTSVENPSEAVERIRKEIKSVFDVDLHINHFHDVLSVQRLLRMIRTPSDIKLNNSASVPLEKKIATPVSSPESYQISENESCELGIIAAACRLPGGIRNTDDLWKFLVEGKSANKRIPLNRIQTRDDLIRGIKYGTPLEGGNFIEESDIFRFDHSLFRISRSEAEWIDPQQRLLLECVYECLENAGLLPDLFVQKSNNNNDESSKFPNKEVIGVFVGLMETEYPFLMKEEEQTGVLSMLGSMTSVVAGRISYVFGCTGPTLTVDTACSSSLMAIELARQSLKEKKCTKAIVAGVNLILTETALGHRANGKMLSEHGMSYSFDARASGYGRADGCSVVLLERAEKSSPYLGIIERINSNHCGRGVSLTAPNGNAHNELISGLFDGSLQPNDISYWEAHGTGTPLGDPIELNVLSKKLGGIHVGSVKASVGHGEAAAGTTSLIKVLMMLKNNYIPPALHFHVLNQKINGGDITISVVGEEKELTRCGISSFGVSGTNVAMIVRKAEKQPIFLEDQLSSFYLVLISGKTILSLDEISKKVQHEIEEEKTPVNFVASSLLHRPHFTNFRLALIYNGEGMQLESFRTDRRDEDWQLNFIHISDDLNPDILQITRINQLFSDQPQQRSREAKLRLALFGFLNEFSPKAQLRVKSPRDYILLHFHEKRLDLSEKFLDDLELAFTLEDVTNLLEVHKIQAVEFPSSFEIDRDEMCALPITNLRSLLRVFAFSYSHGQNDNYKIIYEKVRKPISGLNYCFDRKDIWFRKRTELFDHCLIGRKVIENDKLMIYENQLSALRHPQLFLRSSNMDISQLDFSVAVEIICAAVNEKVPTPIHISNLKIVHVPPEQSEKAFLKVTMNKNEKETWKISATIGPHFFFSCDGANNHAKLPGKVELAELLSSHTSEQDHPYRAICSQLWHMGTDLSSFELFLYKPLTTEFEIKKTHSKCGIAILANEDLLLELFFSKQSQPDNRKVVIPEKPRVEGGTNQEANNLKEKVRNIIIEALDDVIPDGVHCELTSTDTGFMELGLDSLSLIEFVKRLNMSTLLTFEVSTSDIFDFPSIDSFNEFLFQKIDKNDKRTADTGKGFQSSKKDESAKLSKAKEDTMNILLQALDDVLQEPLSNVDVKSGFMQLGLDSIALVDFINRLNDRYFPSLNITTSHLFEFVNLDELTDFIVSEIQKGNASNLPEPSDFHLAQEVKPPDDQVEDRLLYKLRKVEIDHTPDCTILLESNQLIVKEQPDVFLKDIFDKLPKNPIINFDVFPNEMIDSEIFEKLCEFARTLIKSKAKVRLVVQNTSKPENQIAISFFKTLSAEQYPKIEFVWPDRICSFRFKGSNYKQIEGSWLITGGLSGIGWACTTWLANFEKVKEIHLVSRRKTPDPEIVKTIEILKQQGTNICIHRADVGDFSEMLEVFRSLESPLNGIIHSAGILRDCRVERQNAHLFEDVYKPKVKGFINLDSLLTQFEMNPSTFLVMSSFTAVCGNIGQSNYGVVNTIMEQKVKERRSKGHLGTKVIKWGNWREVGMASDPKLIQHLEEIGLPGLNTEQALNCIELAINAQEESLLVAKINFEKLLDKRTDIPSDLLIPCHELEDVTYNIPMIGVNIFYNDEATLDEEKNKVFQNFGNSNHENVKAGRFVEEVLAMSTEEFYDKIEKLTCLRKERIPMQRMVWLFPGQGSQYVGMSNEFSAIFPIFRQQFLKNLKIAQSYFDQDLLEVITTSGKGHHLEQTSYGQPLLVCFCHALFVLWESVGLTLPDFLLGHSVGELVAGVIAQMITLEQALLIAVSRGRAMEKSRDRGALLAVDTQDVYELISVHNVHISAWNSKNQTVLAGDFEKLEDISNELKSKGYRATFINDTYPFHSPLIHSDDLEEFKLLLDSIEFGHSETGIISCITGEILYKFTTAYLISHVTQPVNFSKCIEKLKNHNVNIWLELGPGQLLSSLIQKTLISEAVADQHLVCSTASGKSCDIENFVKTALDLEKAGVFIRWDNIFLNNYANIEEEERLITWPIVETHTISNEEEQILKCHIVRDEAIIPAAFQLTKIYEWISKLISCSETIELTNIKLFSPWKLTSGKHFKTMLTSSNQVILEVRGQRITTCQVQYKERRNRLIDINIWKEQCKEELDIKHYYKQQAENGTEYGQYFQLLHSMKIGGNKILCKAHLKSMKVWTLIDASFHSVCPLMLTRRSDLIFIPAAIGSIDMITSEYALEQCEIWILSEILEYNEKFIRVNSSVTVCPDGTEDYEIIFQGSNEISVMDGAPVSNNIMTSATTSQYTNDCSSVQSESWPADESDDVMGSIGIIGYDCMFCHDSCDPEALWDNLIGHNITSNYKYRKRTSETSPTLTKGVGLIDTAVHQWEPEFFGISPREAPFVDVSQRLLLKVVSRCLERTGIPELPKNTAVLVGLSGCDFEHLAFAEMIRKDFEKPNAFYTTGIHRSCAAGRLAHFLGTEGPALTLDTACSSSMTGIWLAYEMLASRRCDMAIIAAVNVILTDYVTDSLQNAGMLSNDADPNCKAFDASANGYKRSEGVACIILTKDSFLVNSTLPSDIPLLAKISCCNLGHNGTASALHVPNGRSQFRVMSVDGTRVIHTEHVECHGSGTAIGDVIECRAITSELQGDDDVTISSIKSYVGHTESVSGLASLITALMQVQHGYRLPQPHVSLVNRQLDSNHLLVNFVGQEANIERIRVNNFGFSGTIGSFILEKSNRVRQLDDEHSPQHYHLAVISAKTMLSLQSYSKSFFNFLRETDIPLDQICSKLQRGRKHYRYRRCILLNFNNEVLWDSNEENKDLKPSSSEEIWEGVIDPQLVSFCFTSSLQLYLRDNVLTIQSVNEYLSELGSDEIEKLTPIQFHKTIGKSYVKGKNIKWKSYNGQVFDFSTIALPSYEFNERPFWPFTKDCIKHLFYKKKRITFSRKLILKKEWSKGNTDKQDVYVIASSSHNHLNGLPSIAITDIPRKRRAKLVYVPEDSTIKSAMNLIEIWKLLEITHGNTLFVAVPSNGTKHSEWTGALRSLASEKAHPYVFVSYETADEVRNEYTHPDLYEAVFFYNGERFVERLHEVDNDHSSSPRNPGRLLLSGSEGGLGKQVQKYLQPKALTKISRRLGANVASFSCANESYDLICHCAGLVKNAPFHRIKEEDFYKIWEAKIEGFKNLERISLSNKCPIVLFSSIASILGSAGQVNYSFVNGLMSSLAEKSKTCTNILHLGPCSDVGMLSGEEMNKIRQGIERRGWNFIESHEVLEEMSMKEDEVIIFDGDFEEIVRKLPHLASLLENFVEKTSNHSVENSLTLVQILKQVSGLTDFSGDFDTPFMKFGIDSLMMEEIRQLIQKHYHTSLKSSELFDNCTLNKMQELLSSKSSETGAHQEMKTLDGSSYSEEIAIIGLSGAFSGSEDVEAFWKTLFEENDSISRTVTSESSSIVKASGILPNLECFDYNFFKMSAEEASMYDPQLRHFVQHAYKALEESGYAKDRHSKKIAVYAGAEPNEYGRDMYATEGSLMELFHMNQKDFAAVLTSYLLNLTGPSVGVYSACSSSLTALSMAVNSLRMGEVDFALVGSVSLIINKDKGYEYEEGNVLSKSGYCRPFQEDLSDGMVRGSSVGCLVLKRLKEAQEDGDHIWATVRSIATNNDGYNKASFMAPSSSGQTICIQDALDKINPKLLPSISYIECHGTGTRVGDEIELSSLQQTYGKYNNRIQIGSVKSNIGHGFAAAGIASIIKCLKMLQTRRVPPHCHLKNDLALGDQNKFFLSKTEKTLNREDMIGISSFGIGGTNGHLILQSVPYSNSTTPSATRKIQILPISGKSEQSVKRLCEKLVTYLEENMEQINLESVAFTLQSRREHHSYRMAVTASTVHEAVEQFRRPDIKIRKASDLSEENIAFFFSPQGVLYPGIEKNTTQNLPIFTENLKMMCERASDLCSTDFHEILTFDKNDNLNKTKYSQIANWILNTSIAKQLSKWSIKANTLLGHSLGEYSAACYSNAITEAECLCLLKARGELCEGTSEAKMLTVRNYNPSRLPHDVEVSAVLSESLKCIVAKPETIDKVKKVFVENDTDFKELKTQKGFHCSMMRDIENEFRNVLDTCHFQDISDIRFVSSMDGEIKHKVDAQYWIDHLKNPVRLDKSLRTICQNSAIKVLIEIGPSGILKALVEEMNPEVSVVHTVLSKKQSECSTVPSQMIQSIADLWSLGYKLDFSELGPRNGRSCYLPTYEFDLTPCWKDIPEKADRFQFYKTTFAPMKVAANHVRQEQNITIIVENESQIEALEESFKNGSKVFTTSKVLEMNSLSSDVIVYLPGNGNLLEPFYLVKHLYEIIRGKYELLVVSDENHAHHSITMGPIRENMLFNQNSTKFIVNQENLQLSRILKLLPKKQEDVIFMTSTHSFSMEFTEDLEEVNLLREEDIGNTVLLLGGTGTIGQKYVNELLDYAFIKKIIVCSRTQVEFESDRVVSMKVDLLDELSVNKLMSETWNEIDSIVHLAGESTSSELIKSRNDMDIVLKTKICSTHLILEFLKEKKKQLKKLILVSSLSSSLIMQGNDDYVSSNTFFNYLALYGQEDVVRSICSIQLPFVKNSRMHSHYNGPLKKYLDYSAIDLKKVSQAVKYSLTAESSVAFSPINPSKLRRLLLEKQTCKISLPERPQTEIETVRSVWKSVLSVEDINDSSNFFELGGNSLSAMQLIWRINQSLNINVSSRKLFESPYFGKFLDEIRGSQKKIPNYRRLGVALHEVPLLPSQEHMYFLHETSSKTEYNLIFSVNFNDLSKINIKSLRYSINSLIACQRSFRTVFHRSGKSIFQKSLSLTECYHNLQMRNLSSMEQSGFIENQKTFKFRLSSKLPPIHICFLSNNNKLRILFNQAHILTDGWSMTVLANDLQKLYTTYQNCEQVPQPEFSLTHYAYQYNQTQIHVHESYQNWVEELQSSIPTQFLSNMVVPKTDTNHFSRIRRLIPGKIWERVRTIARNHRTTEFVVVLTSYLLAVRRNKMEPFDNRIMIGCPVSGRNEENESFIGYFLNNMIINVDLPYAEFNEAIRVVKASLERSKTFEDVPYHRLIADVRMSNSNMRNLFDLYFNFRHSLEYPNVDIGGISPEIEQISLNSIFDLSTTIDEKPNGTEILIEYNTHKYSIDEVKLFIDDMLKHVGGYRPDSIPPPMIADFPQMSIAQAIMHQLGMSNFKTNHGELTMSSAFQLSYDISNNFFLKMGRTIRSDDLIAINLNRNKSVEYILAILLSGAGYVPLDSSWPEERQSLIRRNTHCDLIIERASKKHSLKYPTRTVLLNRNHLSDVTYVIHTSGSTGKPKGVVIEHRNVLSFVMSAIRQILLNPNSVVLNSVNTVFDVSVSNIFTSLFAASTLAYQDNEMGFLDEIRKNNCTYCFLPSAVFNQIPSPQLEQLQVLDKLAIGGESINEHKLHHVLRLNVDVLQIYGPTETTVWSLTNRCKLGINSGILIGKPYFNEICQISDDRLLFGELLISGSKVARGYILDENRFQSFNGQYSTSDLVFKWKNSYYFHGRLDDQTKVRGQLVNLHHIEEAIMNVSNMQLVHVTMMNGKLIAFVSKNETSLKHKLLSLLPSYMVPSYFIEVTSLSLNTSGKVDRKKLLETFEHYKRNQKKVKERADHMSSWIEVVVRSMFQELTQNEEFDDEEDFFNIGGHSLLLMEIQTRIEESFQIKIEISQMYEALTVKELSKLIASIQYDSCDECRLVPITTIRETSEERLNIYFVHAVGGSILPYYAFLNIFPANRFNLYAIEYDLGYTARSLKELAASYALSIAKHAKNKIPYLIGHSLGGVVCREMINDIELYSGYRISLIVMLDSWAIDQRKLCIEKVKAFAQKVFMNMPDYETRVQKATTLAKMLKEHKNTVSNTDIHLFKAEKLGDASFRLAVRNELDERGAISMIANGLEKYCLGRFHTYLLPGDHESCMKLHNLKHRKQEMQEIFKDLPVWK